MLHQLFRSRFAMRMLLALYLALLGMSTFLVVGPAHTAHADTVTLVCPVGTADVTYSPGLTFTPRATHFVENNDVVSCVGTGDVAGINSGDHSLSETESLSCADLFTYDNTQLLACLSPNGLTAISGVQTFEIL